MLKFFVVFIVIVLLVRKRRQSANNGVSPSNAVILNLLKSHGVRAYPDGAWVLVPEAGVKVVAVISDIRQYSAHVSVRLDVTLQTSEGHNIIESFAGIGKTELEAIENSFRNFTTNTFHVFLGAFINDKDERIDREIWTFKDRKVEVHLGPIGIFGNYPDNKKPVNFWFPKFENILRSLDGGRIHWARLYYACMPDGIPVCEVLIDNEICEKAQSCIVDLEWPESEKFYSVRNFIVIKPV